MTLAAACLTLALALALALAGMGSHITQVKRRPAALCPTAGEKIDCRWLADRAAVVLDVGGRPCLTMEASARSDARSQAGDTSKTDAGSDSAAQGPSTEAVYRDADGAEWTIVSQPSTDGGFAMTLSSKSTAV